MILNTDELLEEVNADNESIAIKGIYEATGASVTFDIDSVTITSSEEQETILSFPFESSEFWSVLEDISDQRDYDLSFNEEEEMVACGESAELDDEWDIEDFD